jgi:hypothetical protein
MNYSSKPGYVREAVGVFKDENDLENALDELQESGFDRSEISLLANEKTVEERLGHYYEKTSEAADDPDAPRVAYTARESLGAAEGALIGAPLYVAALTSAGLALAAGGPIAMAIAAAAIGGGAGALAGATLAGFVDKKHVEEIETQLEHGGIVVWVDLRSAEQEARAMDILNEHNAKEVHVHEVPYKGASQSSWASSESK